MAGAVRSASKPSKGQRRMRNVERYELRDPAEVLDEQRKRERGRQAAQGWRQKVRDQQNPPPKVDRYSEMYDRLIVQRGKH